MKNDMIFILVLLLILTLAGIFYFFCRETGSTVTISINGEFFGEYALNEDRTVEIRMGENINILVISDGRAYVETASCPDGICKAHRPIFRDGESIVCLPNQVVITVKAD